MVEPTAEFAPLQLGFVDQTLWRYEVICPLVLLADRTAQQRAQETRIHPDTVRTLQRRFRQQGMRGLLPADVRVRAIATWSKPTSISSGGCTTISSPSPTPQPSWSDAIRPSSRPTIPPRIRGSSVINGSPDPGRRARRCERPHLRPGRAGPPLLTSPVPSDNQPV